VSANLEWLDDHAYFVDGDATRHRAHVVAFGPPLAAPGKKRTMPLESVEANHRHFVSEGDVAPAYHFTKQENRRLSVEKLEQQFHGAGFVATLPRDAGARRPT
jgi:hypothetical protein